MTIQLSMCYNTFSVGTQLMGAIAKGVVHTLAYCVLRPIGTDLSPAPRGALFMQ